MKKLVLLIITALFFSCNHGHVQHVKVSQTDSSKVALVLIVNSLEVEFPKSTPDSIILKQTRLLLDSIRRQDSISKREKQVLDSLSFRKITRIINGGYNGFNHRYKLYENSKKALENYPDTLFK